LDTRELAVIVGLGGNHWRASGRFQQLAYSLGQIVSRPNVGTYIYRIDSPGFGQADPVRLSLRGKIRPAAHHDTPSS
jgi:hypothetical protein